MRCTLTPPKWILLSWTIYKARYENFFPTTHELRLGLPKRLALIQLVTYSLAMRGHFALDPQIQTST